MSTTALERVNPQALIAAAIEKGAGIETLERLVALAKDVREVTAREAWYEAMAEFQHACPPIKKSATARIATRTGSSFSYSYAPLDEILATIQPVMGKLGLSVSWRSRMEPNAVVANCWIAHKFGHHEESGDVVMPFANDGRMNPAQVVGSASTYAKRYALLSIIGMAPEDDDDASSTHGTKKNTDEAPLSERDDFTAPSTREGVGPNEQDRQFYVLKMGERAKRDKLTPAEKKSLMEAALGSVNADIMTVPIEKLHDLYIAWDQMVERLRKQT